MPWRQGEGTGAPTSPATVRPKRCPHSRSSPCCNSSPWKDTEHSQQRTLQTQTHSSRSITHEVLPASSHSVRPPGNCPALSYRLPPFPGASAGASTQAGLALEQAPASYCPTFQPGKRESPVCGRDEHEAATPAAERR